MATARTFGMRRSWTALLAVALLTIAQQQAAASKDILVLYLYSSADSQYRTNLNYFVKEAMEKDTRSEYYVLVPKKVKQSAKLQLPNLPDHGQYIYNAPCSTFGAFGWALYDSGQIRPSYYKYFIMMDATARGPFLPVYASSRVHWAEPFLKRLGEQVKLVGPTISCQPVQSNPKSELPKRDNPYVQGYFMATDYEGLQVMHKEGSVFKCYSTPTEVGYHSIMGASAAVLAAGYTLDSLMMRYQKVDWRDQDNWGCNARLDPLGQHSYDGITLDPMEVVFVVVRSMSLQKGITYARKADKYASWRHEVAKDNYTWLNSNEYTSREGARLKLPKILFNQLRGPGCFDYEHYLARNPDLAVLDNNWKLWQHFLFTGQFEQRQHRFKCEADYKRMVELALNNDITQLVDPRVVQQLLQSSTKHSTAHSSS